MPELRAAELRQLISEANRAYYELDAPVMADADWDRAFRNCTVPSRPRIPSWPRRTHPPGPWVVGPVAP